MPLRGWTTHHPARWCPNSIYTTSVSCREPKREKERERVLRERDRERQRERERERERERRGSETEGRRRNRRENERTKRRNETRDSEHSAAKTSLPAHVLFTGWTSSSHYYSAAESNKTQSHITVVSVRLRLPLINTVSCATLECGYT